MKVGKKAISIAREIFKANCLMIQGPEEYEAWCSAFDIMEYMLANNITELEAYKKYYKDKFNIA